jgi:hypothetical protein
VCGFCASRGSLGIVLVFVFVSVVSILVLQITDLIFNFGELVFWDLSTMISCLFTIKTEGVNTTACIRLVLVFVVVINRWSNYQFVFLLLFGFFVPLQMIINRPVDLSTKQKSPLFVTRDT